MVDRDDVPEPGSLASPDGRALFVDYAGVLTGGVAAAWRRFEEEHGIPTRTVTDLLWSAYSEDADDGIIARLERGEMAIDEFEQRIAEVLSGTEYDIEAEGIVGRLFEDLTPAGGVWDLVAEVRSHGVPAVMVSNSWGMDGYPRAQLERAFDGLVISGRVGMRKPNRDIFEHAASLVEASLERCLLVDDGPANVEAAERHGMLGVLHRGDDEATRAAVLAGLDLA